MLREWGKLFWGRVPCRWIAAPLALVLSYVVVGYDSLNSPYTKLPPAKLPPSAADYRIAFDMIKESAPAEAGSARTD